MSTTAPAFRRAIVWAWVSVWPLAALTEAPAMAEPPKPRITISTETPKSDTTHMGVANLTTARSTERVQIRRAAPGASYEVADWWGQGSRLPNAIPRTTKPTTVVLADQLALGDVTYSRREGSTLAPDHVVLVVGRLDITGTATIDLRGVHRTGPGYPKARPGYVWVKSTSTSSSSSPTVHKPVHKPATSGRVKTGTKIRDHRSGTSSSGVRHPVPKPSPSGNGVPAARGHWQRATRGYYDGGTMTLVAREVTCGPNGKLVLDTSAGPHGRPNGGKIALVVERWAEGARACVETQTAGQNGGKAGEVVETDVDGVLPGAEDALRQGVSSWLVKTLDDLELDLERALAAENRRDQVRHFRDFKALAGGGYEVTSQDRDLWRRKMQSIRQLRQDYLPALWVETVRVTPPGLPSRELDLFIDTEDLSARLVPIEAPVVPRSFGPARKLGILEFDPDEPEIVDLSFEVRLDADPYLVTLANEQLADEGYEVRGIFSDWVLEPDASALLSRGVLDADVEPLASGSGFHVSLRLHVEESQGFLLRLTSPAGVRLPFTWRYRRDPRITGEWNALHLTLARRTESPLHIEDGNLVHGGQAEVTVDYLRAGDEYRPLEPAWSLMPGDRRSLPSELGGMVDVPALATTWSAAGPSQLAELFEVVNGQGLVDTVTVTNLLGYDEERGGALERVELTLTYGDAAGAPEERHLRLTSRGTLGSERQVTFLRQGSGSSSIRVAGTAFYEGNSLQNLEPVTLSQSVIHITSEMLPGH